MEKFLVESGCGDILSNSQRHRTKLGEISLLTPCRATLESYEIYCIEGNLFHDVERYDTAEEAESRINDLLL